MRIWGESAVQMIPEAPAENTMPTALAKRVFGDTSFGKWIPFLKHRFPAKDLFRSGVLGLQLRSLCAGLCPQPPTVGNSNTTVHTINASWRNLVLLSPYLRRVFCKRDLQDCSFEVLSLFKKGVDHDTGIDGVVHSMFCRIAVLQWPRRQKSVPKECSTRAGVFPQENCCACIPTKAFKSFECCRSPLSKIIFRAWTATNVVQCSEECVEAYKTIFWIV